MRVESRMWCSPGQEFKKVCFNITSVWVHTVGLLEHLDNYFQTWFTGLARMEDTRVQAHCTR